jgi:hypothetical protein
MLVNIACEALRAEKCLEVRYDGFSRVVEVHAVGYTKENNAVMRVWQVRGGSVSNERTGWKLLRLDETLGGMVLSEKSQAPRRDYKRGDAVMERIICQL